LSHRAGLHGLDPPDGQAGVERGAEHAGQVGLADPPDDTVARLDHQAAGLDGQAAGFQAAGLDA
jgi:hypothetical protein